MNIKYTIDEVKNVFSDNGCELLSEDFQRVHDKLNYKCSCGVISVISFSSFLSGCRCKECGNKKKGRNIRYSYDQVKDLFDKQGCKLLSTKYKNAREKLAYQCSCGNISDIRLTHFLRGSRCKICGGNKTKIKLKYDYSDVDNIFKSCGCKLLSKKYIDSHSNLDYECSCGDKSKISLSHFLSGQRCKKCGIAKMTGENNHNYNPNLTDKDRIDRRKIPENEVWRKKIYEKNDFTCQKCLIRGVRLNAHHINNYFNHKDLRFEESNGITFCQSCHKKFHKIYGNKNNTQEQLFQFLNF